MKEDGLKMISRVSQRHKCRQQRHVLVCVHRRRHFIIIVQQALQSRGLIFWYRCSPLKAKNH